jgi:nitrite reductase/ring-hydroxylating ferredoxin subunit
MERHFACALEDITPGTAITVKFDGIEPIALIRTEDGEVHATSDTCTHENWSLGEDGDVEDTEIVCPLHLARFDIRTGDALCFPATVALRTFAVQLDSDGNVYVLA